MTRRQGLFAAVIAGLAVVALLPGCSGAKDPWEERAGPKVLAYFPPLYSLAAQVAGDDAQVQSLLTIVGPHHFDPTTRDARKLHRADLFLTIGLGLEDSIAEKLAATAGKRLKPTPLGEFLPKETLREGGCACCRAGQHDHEHDPNHVEYDPHVWLGIPESVRMVEGIAAELIALDPAHADGYRRRSAETAKRLQELETEGRALIAAKQEKARLITFHDSLFYFARSYGAEVVASIESPGQQTSLKKIDELVKLCQEHNARLIAVEPQYPTNNSATTLLKALRARGIDAEFIEIDPLETADPDYLDKDWYFTKTRMNFTNLAKALK